MDWFGEVRSYLILEIAHMHGHDEVCISKVVLLFGTEGIEQVLEYHPNLRESYQFFSGLRVRTSTH